jgi:hypothetical protein
MKLTFSRVDKYFYPINVADLHDIDAGAFSGRGLWSVLQVY